MRLPFYSGVNMQASISLFPSHNGLSEYPVAGVNTIVGLPVLQISTASVGPWPVMMIHFGQIGDVIAFGQSIIDAAKAAEGKP